MQQRIREGFHFTIGSTGHSFLLEVRLCVQTGGRPGCVMHPTHIHRRLCLQMLVPVSPTMTLPCAVQYEVVHKGTEVATILRAEPLAYAAFASLGRFQRDSGSSARR